MIQEIKETYKEFGDALINRVGYNLTYPDKEIQIFITCLNWNTEKFEKVEFLLKGVRGFRFIETYRTKNSVVFEALLEQKENYIVLDFFPIQVDGTKIEEDPNSDFSIHCEEIAFKVL